MPKLMTIIMLVMLVAFTSAESAGSSEGRPLLGFNVKGSLNTAEQVAMLREELSQRENVSELVLRIQGGTRSQRDMPNAWTDEKIEAWTAIQEEFGCTFIFVPNFNDTPESQYALFQRWKAAGAEYALIELMNEPYLPKFRLAHDDPRNIRNNRFEVTPATEHMTPQKYIEMATEFARTFSAEGLPFAASLAPEWDGRQGELYAAWNDAVIEAIVGRANVHATLHLYRRMPGQVDLDQINRLKSRIGDRRLLVTEAGVLVPDDFSYEEFVELETVFLSDIIGHLDHRDLLLSQVLYSDYRRLFEPSFHPHWEGLSPKGEAMFDLFGFPEKQR